jgi:hypothetical protein
MHFRKRFLKFLTTEASKSLLISSHATRKEFLRSSKLSWGFSHAFVSKIDQME